MKIELIVIPILFKNVISTKAYMMLLYTAYIILNIYPLNNRKLVKMEENFVLMQSKKDQNTKKAEYEEIVR